MYRIAVTNRHLCEGDFLVRIRQLAAGEEYEAILLREKDLTEAKYRELAEQVLRICRAHQKKCILHTFYETAEALKHPYIHLPLPILEEMEPGWRKSFREIGTSVHSVTQAEEAERLGATYITAGHIFATDCKKGLPPRGVSFLRDVCERVSVPVYGIGGINRDNEEQIIENGASGVCIMSGSMRE